MTHPRRSKLRTSGAVVALGLTIMASAVMAQDPARMAQIAKTYSDSGEFSGSVLVARDGQVLMDQGFGMANREWSIPNDGQTKFRIGSVTKQFTAAAILLLNEQAKLDLDAPIKTWIADAPAAWDSITLRHLLSHTAGIPNFTSFDDYVELRPLPATLDSLIARFEDKPLEFQPGEKFAYSNSGYILLSAVIEKVSGQTYEAYVTDHLFKPAGMADTGYDRDATVLPHRASGYMVDAARVVNAPYTDMTIPSGAGALYSTTHDLWAWNQALFGGKILKPNSLTAMTTPVLDNYAMGILATASDGHRLLTHSGGIEGFNAYLAYDPDARSTIVVLGNLNGAAPDRIGNHLVTLMQGGSVTLKSERTTIEVAQEVLRQYEGAYPLAPTFVITVRVVDGQLTAQATGQPSFTLKSDAADSFFLTVVEARVVFTRDAEGKVDGLVLHQNGQSIPGKKQQP